MGVGHALVPLTSEPMHTAQPIDSDENFAVAVLPHYAILVWRREITDRGAVALRDAFEVLHAQSGRFGFLTVVRPECSVMTSADVRAAVSDLLRTHEHSIAAAAVAHEGTGFVSAVVRSIITAINIATNARFANEVFSDRSSAISWLTQRLHEPDSQATSSLEQLLTEI